MFDRATFPDIRKGEGYNKAMLPVGGVTVIITPVPRFFAKSQNDGLLVVPARVQPLQGGRNLQFSKPYSVWFWQVEMSECIYTARTVTETSVALTDVETVA
jgi:hypothetical protein